MQCNRRSFLGGLAAAGLVNSSSVTAADPPVRHGGSYLKLSLAGYSFRSLMVRRGTADEMAAAKMTIPTFIDYCAEQGLGAAELTGYYFPKEVTPEYLLAIRQQAHRLGISISGTAIGNDFCVADETAGKAQIADCLAWIDYAALMGAPAIRIFAGKVPKGDYEEAARNRCVAAINQCLPYAAEKGVFLALENHGGITATPEQLLQIVKAVDSSPWFGVNFDSGNFRTADPYADLEKIAPYAVNAQIKASIHREDAHEKADFERIISILRNAGYRGFVAFEYEEPEPPLEAVPQFLKQLRQLTDA
ncbi:MAG: sugar phosphate isomerase/epimerase [Planctomycetaceae bacterium]|nr:sugar phosphate isomerase/epimerase [Planctomycetaceae bacterium]